MARVVVGQTGSEVVVESDRCVKSGVQTSQRVTVRGSTTPGWVHVLLIFTIIGWLFASGMASRRYRVELPSRHELYEGWRRLNRTSWVLGLLGVGLWIWGTTAGVDRAGLFLAITVGALTLGMGNALLNNVGVRQQDPNELVLTRVHPDAVAAITAAHSTRP